MTTTIETPSSQHDEVDATARGGRFLGGAIVAAVALTAVAVVYVAAAGGSTTPADGGVAAPLADGEHEGQLRFADDGALEVDVVEVLSGQEAIDAAHADGELPESEDSLPNDVYVRNTEVDWVTFPVAADAELALYDCTTSCELVGAEVEELFAGTVTPFGGTSATFALTVTDGEVTRLAEVYLP